MEKIIRQSVGIDCSKGQLDVSFGIRKENFDMQLLSTTAFSNDRNGWGKMWKWSQKLKAGKTELVFVVEATGVYHESVAEYLHKAGAFISVVLPNKVKHFAKTLAVKTITDKISAQIIAQFGLEKKLDKWDPPHPVYGFLRQLTRERDQLNVEKTQILCQLHAEQSGAWPNKGSIARMKKRIAVIKQQIKQVEKELRQTVKAQPWLAKKVAHICTIKGVGFITAITVIAECGGFNLIRNKRQVTSYAGLDAVLKDSGTSVKSKPKISRKGNKYLRKAVYLPALSAIRSNRPMKVFFARLVARHGIKMKAVAAIQRKLLELIYVLWKKEEDYNPDYLKKLEQPLTAALNEMA